MLGSMPWPTKQHIDIARISARKVRPLADLIRGKRVDDALAILQVSAAARRADAGEGAQERAGQRRRSAGAERRAACVIIDARVDGGPMFKRMRPRARGMAHVVKRRFAHISVEVE